MEERIIDKDESRKIRIKKTAAGGVLDAVEESAPETDEEELAFELPEIDETDEDLIGLAPSQLQKELERREKAAQQSREERDKLLAEADRFLRKSDFERAGSFYAQALLYDPESVRAKEGVWTARTENFENLEKFFVKSCAEEFSELDGETKSFVRKRVLERLEAERAALKEEAKPLEEKVSEGRERRRGAFYENRKYYLVRFSIFFSLFALFMLGAGISANFIVRTTTIVPIVLVAMFGGLGLITLSIGLYFARKLILAQRLCRDNERLSSTDDGARLEYLNDRLECLSLVLDDE